MIRFPNRLHASDTPADARVEANWQESRRANPTPHQHGSEHKGRRRKHFDFGPLAAALR